MRALVVALVAAAWLLQAPAPPRAAANREAAYRANNRGVAHLEQFAYDDAIRAFREALQQAPDLDLARLNLAIAEFYGGRGSEATADARTAVERMPASPTAHYIAALIAKADNRIDDAAAAFARVLELDPIDAGALTGLGQMHLQQRRYVEAQALFDRALAAEPYNVTAAYNAALAITRAGRAEEGRAAMQRFERLRDSAYGVTYAQTYLTQGRYAEAIASTGAEPDLVESATPAVTFGDASPTWLGAQGAGGAGAAGGVNIFDANGDGALDIVSAGSTGVRLLRNTSGRFADVTAAAGLQGVPGAIAVIAGDYDNDGRPDLLVISTAGPKLFRQKDDGGFENVTAAVSLPAAPPAAAAAAFADLDHDGDLDIVIAGATVQALRNNGDGRFTDITTEAGFAGALGSPVAVAPTDYDNRRDVDVLIAAGGRAPLLFRNMRDGTFRDTAADAGLTASGGFTAVAVGDVNKDGYPDVFLGQRDGEGVLALSDGRGHFRTGPAAGTAVSPAAAQFVDYDNDGVLDLLTLSSGGVKLARNVGGGRWVDVTQAANLGGFTPGGTSAFQSMALGDLDRDGDTDVAIRTDAGTLRLLRNDGGSRHASLRVRLTARVSNRSAAGAKVELRAGSLRQVLEISSSSPAVAPADIVFGLGSRRAADVVRVLWPSGILQAEMVTAAQRTTSDLQITELDRKPSSCPYLFTWNGSRFEFVTDFMGGGEMGGWAGPGLWNQPDPDEYVRIRNDQLRPRDGRYELRVTNELEEALFVDRLQLVAVDHRDGMEVYPNEGLRQGPREPFALQRVSHLRPPVRAVDDHGHDVLDRIALNDRRYPDDFSRLAIRGFAASHTLDLDLGPGSDDAVLLMTGWTDYAFSSDSVAAAQAGLSMSAPSLQVRDASGAWRTAIDDIGFPVGRPQTIAVNLAGRFLSPSREVRIVTNMRIFWDRIVVASAASGATRLTRLDPIAADLRSRGFSAESTPDGREPFGYDYAHVSTGSPWKVPAGRYTREGDVRPLIRAIDDMFAISRSGDELAVSFDARALPPPAAGWTRTFLLYAHGYSKEMNPRSATPDTVAPLPFRGMTRYPYGTGEQYPWTPARRRYDAEYNTRVVTKTITAIDAALAQGQR